MSPRHRWVFRSPTSEPSPLHKLIYPIILLLRCVGKLFVRPAFFIFILCLRVPIPLLILTLHVVTTLFTYIKIRSQFPMPTINVVLPVDARSLFDSYSGKIQSPSTSTPTLASTRGSLKMVWLRRYRVMK